MLRVRRTQGADGIDVAPSKTRRLLCIEYGPNAGIIPWLGRALGPAWTVERCNPLSGFLYRKALGFRIPTATPAALGTVWHAWRSFGSDWPSRYLHTVYVFDILSRRVAEIVARSRPDCVLQAGALFSPQGTLPVPLYLYLDHTRAIDERYEALPGVSPPPVYDSALHARERRLYQSARAIFCMSEHARSSVIEDYGIDASLVQVVGTGPDVVPSAPPVRSAAGKEFLFVGVDFARKGGRILLEAFARVRERRPDARLVIAGGYRGDRTEAGVMCLGRLGAEELRGWYARAFAFVLPTLREPFGRVFLEAMAFGLPCIGTTVEAVPEIIVDGETGLLVPPGDSTALAAAMTRLLEAPGVAAAMGDAGRRRLLDRFGWARTSERIAALITAGGAG